MTYTELCYDFTVFQLIAGTYFILTVVISAIMVFNFEEELTEKGLVSTVAFYCLSPIIIFSDLIFKIQKEFYASK